jgi:hypothetical protein
LDSLSISQRWWINDGDEWGLWLSSQGYYINVNGQESELEPATCLL